jgi:hypothetical protein
VRKNEIDISDIQSSTGSLARSIAAGSCYSESVARAADDYTQK